MKKIIIVIAAIIFISAISVGVYFAWQKSQEILTPPGESAKNQFSNYQFATTTLQKENLKSLSDQAVFDYWVTQSSTSSEIFYVNESGQILKIAENEDEVISDRIIEDLQQVKSNKDGDKIIIKYGEISSPQFEIFDLKKKVWQNLNNISAADFSPDGKNIIYLENSSDLSSSNLTIKEISNTKQKTTKILSFKQKDFDLKWLSSDKVLLVSLPSSKIEGEIWVISIKNKTLKLFDKGYGLMVNWAKDNSYGLRFSNDGSSVKLNLIDQDGVIKANVNFSTLPDKCWISIGQLYCAVYSVNSKNSLDLPDDYFKKSVYFKDKFYSIDLTQNSFKQININSELSIDAIRISASSDDILFINRYDKKVYQLKI